MGNPILNDLNNVSSNQINTNQYGANFINDPRFRMIKDLLSKNNMSAKQAFFSLAKSKGIDPNSIINLIK